MSISDNVKSLLAELPPGVTLIAAVKGRTVREIMEAIEAGITTVGENYLQEAHDHFSSIGKKINWHFIGSLQQNKVKSAAQIFDMVETVDSVALATALSRYASRIGKVLQVLVEVNSGEEPQKSGVRPEKTESLLRNISALENIRVVGLMTMGPRFGNPEDSRPYFAVTRRLSEDISSLRLPGVSMDCLSMGMTNTYRIAIQEGANLIRIGNKIFGERA
jgi:pyridoxal phosphate enzyme (YggS family)